jgi:hypothetical protein
MIQANKGVKFKGVFSDPLAPTNGMIIYREDLGRFRKYESGAWTDVNGANTSLSNLSSVAINTGLVFGTSVAGVLTTASALNTTGLTLSSANSTSNGTTGDILIKVGTTTGTRGKVKIQDGSEGTVGHFLRQTAVDGTVGWAAVSGATALYVAVIGTAGDITAGRATHTTIQSAVDAFGSAGAYLILAGINAGPLNTDTSPPLIQGQGQGSTITSLILTSGSDNTTFKNLRISGTTTINSGSNGHVFDTINFGNTVNINSINNRVINYLQESGVAINDNGSNNFFLGLSI